jgi:hypothetical protein
VNPGIRIVGHGDGVRLEIGSDSNAARRELGLVAWSVLELLALAGEDVDGRWIAMSNAREIASRLGIGKDRAASALGTLREAGLVVAQTSRDASSSRFAAGCYEVRLPVSDHGEAREPRRLPPQPDASRARTRARSSTEALDLFSSRP